MKITNIWINHMKNPVGFKLDDLLINFSLEDVFSDKLEKQLEIFVDKEKVYDTGMIKYQDNKFFPKLALKPRTKYDIKITVRNGDTLCFESSFFETGKMNEKYTAKWIGNQNKNMANTMLKREIEIDKPLKKASLYATGLGVYEVYIDKLKVGQEVLAPGFTEYDQYIQVQTYDVTTFLREQGIHTLEFSLGDGWYKGRLGFDGGETEIYGDRQRMLSELYLKYEDGTEKVIRSDKSWKTRRGNIIASGIYYGEDLNDNNVDELWQNAVELNYPLDTLGDRLSLPLKISEYLKVKDIIMTPKKEIILDFGQNHAGWIEFYNKEPQGHELIFQMGEVLQDGNFYRDNLRDARATFKYTSDGKEGWVHPHFTYFGYRYVKVLGVSSNNLSSDNFRSAVIHSDLEETGLLMTDNDKINRFFKNVLWGQKSNFFDIPTDCPQRDERLGWTGDANIFSKTSAYNMNVYPFFRKYAHDILIDQRQNQGALSMYVPSLKKPVKGVAVWGDAAVMIAWNMYQVYGDLTIIKQNYRGMKSWVEWIGSTTKKDNLWIGSVQFGDWVALDSESSTIPIGKTDVDYIASAYYYQSARIVAQAAKLIGEKQDEEKYIKKAHSILDAIQAEYFTRTGRLVIDTQTAYTLALAFKLVSGNSKKQVCKDLITRLRKDKYHLTTGFVGTPLICKALSEIGRHDLAIRLFLNEDYPSWLYAVNMGATTVWERWNSLLPNKKMNPEGMNSLNHYSLGAVMEWAYEYIWGLKFSGNEKKLEFSPKIDSRISEVCGFYISSYGKFEAKYERQKEEFILEIIVPFGQEVSVALPFSPREFLLNGKNSIYRGPFVLSNGKYVIKYSISKYQEYYPVETEMKEIVGNNELMKKMSDIYPIMTYLSDNHVLDIVGNMTLEELSRILPLADVPSVPVDKLEKILTSTYKK